MNKEEKLVAKLEEMMLYENRLYEEGVTYIAGVDEVGRGPLAGPVIAAAVVLPKDFHVLGIDDSKKLSEKKRDELFDIIKANALSYGIGVVENDIIDEINILEATKLAMKKAIFKVAESLTIDHLLIDALTLKDVDIPQTGIIKGDVKSVSIAAASIIAKVTRDRLMADYSKTYVAYSFEKNKGYGTKAHYEGLDKAGICPIHRGSFLKKYLGESSKMILAIEDKLEALRDKLRGYGSLAVAFSGGVDSTFLLLMAKEALGDKVVAITADASAFSREEMEEAVVYCQGNNIKQILIKLNINEIDGFKENPENRCYFCKKSIFSRLLEAAKSEDVNFIADGTNFDDISDYRPGLKALEELKIQSPLREVGFTKNEIRQVLKKKGLDIWEKPAYACLATRIPYGQPITDEKLRQIDEVEGQLHAMGYKQVRVRHHDSVARIEVLPEERSRIFDTQIMDRINEIGKKAGFEYVSLDLAGYKMGNLNKK